MLVSSANKNANKESGGGLVVKHWPVNQEVVVSNYTHGRY